LQPSDPSPGPFFSASYPEARGKFLAAANLCDWTIASHPVSSKVPSPGPLCIDVASSSPAAPRTLLLTGGLHGVEGYLGSAVQLAILGLISRGQLVIPPDCRIVMVHALNPFGFAHNRRTDEHNVDLNRNFLLPGEPYHGSPPGYARIDPLINPPPGPPSRFESFKAAMLWHGCTMGFSALKSAIACGQYDYPRGLFYGGDGPSDTFDIVRRELPAWIPPGSDAAIMIDLHTGLGRHGAYALLTPLSASELAATPLAGGFTPSEISSMTSGPVAYPARGTLTGWVSHHQSARHFHAWGLEFGTWPGLHVLSALRAENRHHDSPSSPPALQAKAGLREAFCPASPAWRLKAIASATSVITRALKVLGTS
jgi:hypothetical protein